MPKTAIQKARMLIPYGKRPTTPEDRRVLNQLKMAQDIPMHFKLVPRSFYSGSDNAPNFIHALDANIQNGLAWMDTRGRRYCFA